MTYTLSSGYCGHDTLVNYNIDDLPPEFVTFKSLAVLGLPPESFNNQRSSTMYFTNTIIQLLFPPEVVLDVHKLVRFDFCQGLPLFCLEVVFVFWGFSSYLQAHRKLQSNNATRGSGLPLEDKPCTCLFHRFRRPWPLSANRSGET